MNTFTNNTGTPIAAQVGTVMRLVGKDATNGRLQNEAYGAVPLYTLLTGGGTAASPTALTSGQDMGGLNWWGFTSPTTVYGPAAAVRAYADQAYNSTAGGTHIDFATTPNNSTTLTSQMQLWNDGGLTSTGVTGGDMGAGSVNFAKLYRNGAAAVTNGNTTVARSIQVAGDTAGQTQVPTNVIVSANDEISGYRQLLNPQTGTSYTLSAADRGTTIVITNSAAITVTLPASLISGFNVEIIQGGAGQITFAAASGATLTNAHGQTKTYAAAGASVRLVVTANSGGTAAAYNLAGDTGS